MSKDISLKWQNEIELYLHFKTTFVLEGEILDKQPYIDQDGDFALMQLDDYFNNVLHDAGYSVVVFFNHVDGFYSFDNKELSQFENIVKNAKKSDDQKDFILTHKGRDSKFGDATQYIRYAMGNTEEPVAIILNMASRYIASSDRLHEDERYFYSELFLASQSMRNPRSSKTEERLNNLMFLCADKLNDVPAWFYLGNPYVKTVMLPLPDTIVRENYIESTLSMFYGYDEVENLSIDEKTKLNRKFVDLTEGFRNVELVALRQLMHKEKIPFKKIDEAISLFKYGIKDNPWSREDLIERLDDLEEDIKEYVIGQDACVSQVSDIISRAVLGLSGLQHSSSKSKPKGIMFFAGPTGTGKTELAKSIARWLFGTEEACIRFDMSEYSMEHSGEKLLGAPPGYIGYESGGQLTNAVKEKPFSIILFDEIEKAHTSILDKFLQILEDGRMTDGKGETVYFSDTIIIFTSNLGVSKTNPISGEKIDVISYFDDNSDYMNYRKKVLTGIDDFFLNQIGRPEIKNRIGDNFIIFEYINNEAAKSIAFKQLNKIKKNLKNEKNIILTWDDLMEEQLYKKIQLSLSQGGRGVGNAIEKYLINPLARYLVSNKIMGNISIKIKEIKEVESTAFLVCE